MEVKPLLSSLRLARWVPPPSTNYTAIAQPTLHDFLQKRPNAFVHRRHPGISYSPNTRMRTPASADMEAFGSYPRKVLIAQQFGVNSEDTLDVALCLAIRRDSAVLSDSTGTGIIGRQRLDNLVPGGIAFG
jgi:hypothetical protein